MRSSRQSAWQRATPDHSRSHNGVAAYAAVGTLLFAAAACGRRIVASTFVVNESDFLSLYGDEEGDLWPPESRQGRAVYSIPVSGVGWLVVTQILECPFSVVVSCQQARKPALKRLPLEPVCFSCGSVGRSKPEPMTYSAGETTH